MQLGFRPWQNRVPGAKGSLSTRQPAFVDNIYLRHNARAVNIKLRHNAPSGTKGRKPKGCHLSVFVQNWHTSEEIPFLAYMKKGWSLCVRTYGPRIKVKGQPTADNVNAGCIMTRHKSSCCAAVLVSLCITFMPGGANGCTGERYRIDVLFKRLDLSR